MDMKKELRRLVEEELNTRIERVLMATKDIAQYSYIQPIDLLRLAQGGKNASLRKKVLSAMVKAKEEDMYKKFFGGETDPFYQEPDLEPEGKSEKVQPIKKAKS